MKAPDMLRKYLQLRPWFVWVSFVVGLFTGNVADLPDLGAYIP